MVRVKICGITNLKDALTASHLGAWALGFVFYRKSPRYISPSVAKQIIQKLPRAVVPVGLFVNEKEAVVKRIAKTCRIKFLQLHGDEPPSFCRKFKSFVVIKAFRISSDFDFKSLTRFEADCVLFDSFHPRLYGGSGQTSDWDLIRKKRATINKPLILSGGLNASNVKKAIRKVCPDFVDVSSGVEKSPGKKDLKRLKDFFKAVAATGC